MPDSRGSRFALEVLFLVALAVGLAVAELEPILIAGVMLLGWVIVAALEWAAWRGEPHYGSGLPPRYYVPSVNLPPAQPLEQVGYPEAQRDEAPTWIASAALRAEMLGEWPVAAPALEEDEIPAVVDVTPLEPEAEEDVTPELEPEPELAAEPEPEPEPEPPLSPPVASEPVPPPPAPEPPPAPDPEPELPPAALAEDDPWVVAELPAAPLGEEEPEPDHEEELAPVLQAVALERSVQGTSRYSLDPLAEPPPRRRFGRGGGGEPAPVVEVPARPDGVRALPGRSDRQD